MASDRDGKLRECGATCLHTTVDSESVLLGNFALIWFVSLIASKLPDLVEVSPKFVDEFLGPGLSCVVGGAVTVTAALFLAVDDCHCYSSMQEVLLPADGLLRRTVGGCMGIGGRLQGCGTIGEDSGR
jgi:hypothetical protein